MSEYTREAGVRQLERELGKLLRKAATKIASAAIEPPLDVDEAFVRDALGRQTFWQEAAERTAIPGVATGLAVTGTGGDVLFIEATRMDGDERLTLTGQLGDVMKESAQIALSWVRAHADELDIPDERLRGQFHVHVPAGAIPKDGPSAGITMTTALASLLSGRPVKHTVGMTGEVTLQGRVLPIGGLKQKVLAAHAAGLTEVIIPERNRHDLDDVPADVREAMTFHPVMSVDEVLELALEPAPSRRRRTTVRCRPCNPVPEEVRRAAGLLERRWTISILYASIEGAERFNEFLVALGRVPPATLATRLNELVEAGLLDRRVLDTRPPASSTAHGGRQAPRARRARARPLVPACSG